MKMLRLTNDDFGTTRYNWCEIYNGCPGSPPYIPPIHPPNWHWPQCTTNQNVITKKVLISLDFHRHSLEK